MCSPHAAQSKWVNEEVLQFKRLGRSSRIVYVLVAGEPNADENRDSEDQECLPEACRFKLNKEEGALTTERLDPLAADMRVGHGTLCFAILKLSREFWGFRSTSLCNARGSTPPCISLVVFIFLVIASAVLGGFALESYESKVRAEMVQMFELLPFDRRARNIALMRLTQFQGEWHMLRNWWHSSAHVQKWARTHRIFTRPNRNRGDCARVGLDRKRLPARSRALAERADSAEVNFKFIANGSVDQLGQPLQSRVLSEASELLKQTRLDCIRFERFLRRYAGFPSSPAKNAIRS